MPGRNGKNGRNGRGANGNGAQSESFAAAITEVSERLTRLVRDEIELAKAEMTEKATSLLRGTAAVAAGAVFGVFAVVFFLLTLAWVIDGIFVTGVGSIWLGFLVVFVVLLVLTLGAFLFAWRKLKVGAPTPSMAIDEAKKIRETVTAKPNGHATALSNGAATPALTSSVPSANGAVAANGAVPASGPVTVTEAGTAGPGSAS